MLRFIALGYLVLLVTPSAIAGVIGFEGLNLYSGTGPTGSYYNGDLGSQTTNSNGWSSEGGAFSNSYTFDPFFGGFWSGFAYSNVADPNTSGFGNQYAARPGSGADGSAQYALAYNGFVGDAVITFSTGLHVNSMDITNTAYTYYSMLDGDGFAKKFGGASGNDPDYLLLKIYGFRGGANTGVVDFYLADYRSADNAQDYIVKDWQKVNLQGLGLIDSLQFEMQSSDNGAFGMNTPAYFAVDNIVLAPLPEPTSIALLIVAGSSFAVRRIRQARRPTCP